MYQFIDLPDTASRVGPFTICLPSIVTTLQLPAWAPECSQLAIHYSLTWVAADITHRLLGDRVLRIGDDVEN